MNAYLRVVANDCKLFAVEALMDVVGLEGGSRQEQSVKVAAVEASFQAFPVVGEDLESGSGWPNQQLRKEEIHALGREQRNDFRQEMVTVQACGSQQKMDAAQSFYVHLDRESIWILTK